MNETTESKKVVYPTGDLPKVWDGINPERLVNGQYLFGSRLFTKMMMFLQHAELLRPDYSHYIGMGPAREDTETYEQYKIRQRFQKALIKYRPSVKQFVFMNTVTKLQQEQKEKENGNTGNSDSTIA